jgi:uncharacterized protein
MLDHYWQIWPFRWHSEHFGYQTFLDHDGCTLDVGVPLPLPNTAEAACLVAERCSKILERFEVPFLLENPAHYLIGLDADKEHTSDLGLQNLIAERSGCGMLLDLHNLYCNSVNHGFDAFDCLKRIRLDRVLEIHVAGGSWQSGFWADAHNGVVPSAVWDLLEFTLPRAPSVAGVVFELLDDWAVRLQPDVIVRELEKVQAIWGRHKRPLVQDACVHVA